MSAYAAIEVGVEALIRRNNQILLGLRGPACYQPNTWGMPGGRVEFMERTADAIAREVLEELGITVAPSSCKFLGHTDDPQPAAKQHHLHLTYQVDIGTAEPKVMEPQSCLEWRWFDLADLPKNMFAPHQLILENLVIPALAEPAPAE